VPRSRPHDERGAAPILSPPAVPQRAFRAAKRAALCASLFLATLLLVAGAAAATNRLAGARELLVAGAAVAADWLAGARDAAVALGRAATDLATSAFGAPASQTPSQLVLFELAVVAVAWFAIKYIKRWSRSLYNTVSRRAARMGAPAWSTSALQKLGPHAGDALRCALAWGVANVVTAHLFGIGIADAAAADSDSFAFSSSATFSGWASRTALLALQKIGADGAAETGGYLHWFHVFTFRFLLAALSVVLARYICAAKEPPPRSANGPIVGSPSPDDAHPSSSDDDWSAAHFAALRGDEGVSWDRQARAVLIDNGLSVVVWFTAAVMCASALRLDVTGLLAFTGVGGVALGFAAQRFVGNLIGGLQLFITQPFKVGDVVAAKQFGRGVVKNIGWHSTLLECDADGTTLILPNSDVSTAPVRNESRKTRRVVRETIPLPAETDAASVEGAISSRAAVFALTRALRRHPGTRGGSRGARTRSFDAAETPRVALELDPGSGALLAKCEYVVDESVPESSVAAVRSGVLVKLREALAEAKRSKTRDVYDDALEDEDEQTAWFVLEPDYEERADAAEDAEDAAEDAEDAVRRYEQMERATREYEGGRRRRRARARAS
jgi:small-conductance mechanosensitive channel